MKQLNRETLLVSVTSGVIAIGLYKILGRICSYATRQSKRQSKEPSKIYEDQKLLEEYMLFNYSKENEMILFDMGKYENIRNCLQFPRNVALLCKDHCPDLFFSTEKPRTALDIGCAVGRSCFELSRLFDSVIGIDYSANFIKYCNLMAIQKQIPYTTTLEGNIKQNLVARIDSDIDVSKIKFEVGDACNLREDLGSFDLVLASNLVCRLVEPLKFLNRLKSLVKPKGYAVLSTPLTWNSTFTNVENWVGGYFDNNGNPVEGLDGLKRALGDSFELRKELQLPMIIRETKRKFQYTFCLITVWQRK